MFILYSGQYKAFVICGKHKGKNKLIKNDKEKYIIRAILWIFPLKADRLNNRKGVNHIGNNL